uniref:Ig-like domain-containing protein n=1 Tax=Gopherus evgoodei TaxID=1825980 RepID=A0A8C4YJD4_9SAUR
MLKGTDVSLECEISGTPPFEVMWYKDKRQIRSSKKYKVTSKNYHASIHILNVDASDIGEYQCKAQNEVGSEFICTESVSGPLFFGKCSCLLNRCGFVTFSYTDRIIPPSFTRKLKETNGVLGSSALLECKVSGSPPISIAWFQDGKKIISGVKHQTTFSDNLCVLQLNSLTSSDTGSYTCKATNVAGSDECRAVLNVQGQYLTANQLFAVNPLLYNSLSFLEVSLIFWAYLGVTIHSNIKCFALHLQITMLLL